MSRPLGKTESRRELEDVSGRAEGGDGSGCARASSREALVALLEEIGAGKVRHSHETLLDHLVGVADILVRWETDEDTVNVGLFHSIYGTEIFQHATVGLDERPRIRRAIGERCV